MQLYFCVAIHIVVETMVGNIVRRYRSLNILIDGIESTFHPHINITALSQLRKFAIIATYGLTLHHSCIKSCFMEHIPQFLALLVNNLISLLNLGCHSHPSEIQHFWRFLPLLLQPLYSGKTYPHKALLLCHRIQFTPNHPQKAFERGKSVCQWQLVLTQKSFSHLINLIILFVYSLAPVSFRCMTS